jgi:hypothetical protein
MRYIQSNDALLLRLASFTRYDIPSGLGDNILESSLTALDVVALLAAVVRLNCETVGGGDVA